MQDDKKNTARARFDLDLGVEFENSTHSRPRFHFQHWDPTNQMQPAKSQESMLLEIMPPIYFTM